MLKRSFRARFLSISNSGRCENEAFVGDFFQIPTVEDVKTKLCGRFLSDSNSWRCENEAFVRDFFQIPTVEDVKAKLSCETSFQMSTVEGMKTKLSWEISFRFEQLKMWKRSFRARFLSNSNSWRCENEAFVRDFFHIPTVEDVKTKFSSETSFNFWSGGKNAWTGSSTAGPVWSWSR